MSETRSVVKVACSIVNGLKLRVSRPGYDEGTGSGMKMPAFDAQQVTLKGPSPIDAGVGSPSSSKTGGVGITEVDAEFFARWLEQNERNPIVQQGCVRVIEDDQR